MALALQKGDNRVIDLRVEVARLIAHMIKGDEKIVEQRDIVPSPNRLGGRARTRV